MNDKSHEISLAEYLETGTQLEVAKALEIGQSAVAQMVAAGRDVRIVLDANKEIVRAYEVKALGRKSTRAA